MHKAKSSKNTKTFCFYSVWQKALTIDQLLFVDDYNDKYLIFDVYVVVADIFSSFLPFCLRGMGSAALFGAV